MEAPDCKETVPLVLSASRRTDIPAFFMDWFMAGTEKGYFDVENPFNRRVSRVAATVDRVHAIVFWSKNYARFLAGDYGERLRHRGYRQLFHFTINSETPMLEPKVPALENRLEQLSSLARRYPVGAIVWRFDPICCYRLGTGDVQNNLGDFERIADAAAACGTTRCISSFADYYGKVRRRVGKRTDFSWVEPSQARRLELLVYMQRVLGDRGMRLELCCEKDLLSALPPDLPIFPGSCISHRWVEAVYGGRLSGKPDRGQRRAAGCGCMESRDIGSYRLHPCRHNCLYCYANPVKDP